MSITLEYVSCDLCGSNDGTLLFQARDYRYGHPEMFNIVKCDYCGLTYINPRPIAESILKFYEKDYTPEDKISLVPKLDAKTWRIILKKLWYRINGQYIDEIISKAERRVLDIGCGNGYVLLSLKRKGHDVYGVETNFKSVEICKKLGLNVFCGTLEEAKFPDEFFDTIIMSQVLEHLPSPKRSLIEVYRILKPGGKVFIYCPNADSYLSRLFGKYWHGWHIPFHFYAFTDKTIKRFAKESGFMVEKISTATPDHFFTVSLKSYLYGEKHNGKRPIERGRFFDSLIFRATISPIFRMLDLLFTGRGDCLKVELKKVHK